MHVLSVTTIRYPRQPHPTMSHADLPPVAVPDFLQEAPGGAVGTYAGIGTFGYPHGSQCNGSQLTYRNLPTSNGTGYNLSSGYGYRGYGQGRSGYGSPGMHGYAGYGYGYPGYGFDYAGREKYQNLGHPITVHCSTEQNVGVVSDPTRHSSAIKGGSLAPFGGPGSYGYGGYSYGGQGGYARYTGYAGYAGASGYAGSQGHGYAGYPAVSTGQRFRGQVAGTRNCLPLA